MTLDTTELRRLAEAATGGTWFVDKDRITIRADDGEGPEDAWHIAIASEGIGEDDEGTETNAAYIAAASPAAVLALLDRLERAEAVRSAAASLDTALSNLWREGPVKAGHENHLGPVDATWAELRAALARASELEAGL